MRSFLRAIVISLVVSMLAVVAFAQEAKERPPFEGKYLLRGEAADLLKGDRIVVEEFISPVCNHCYLYRKNGKPYGDDLKLVRFYVVDRARGKLAAKLLLIARDTKPELEEKLLDALFDAYFEKKVNVDDGQVISAIAASVGLDKAWSERKDDPEFDKRLKEADELRIKRGVWQTPSIVIQEVLVLNPGFAECTSDELPDSVVDILNKVREYREKNKK